MSAPLGTEPAFPVRQTGRRGIGGAPIDDIIHPGMSTRTWLAGTIAAGILANPWFCERASKNPDLDGKLPDFFAANAIKIADALLARLERSASPTPTSVSPGPQSGS